MVKTKEALVVARIPSSLKKRMKEFPHVNWSDVIRKAIEEKVREEEHRLAMLMASELRKESRKGKWMGPWKSSEEAVRHWRDLRR